MVERQLVTLDNIADIRPIADADAIEAATVRDWTVVVRKGEFEVGDVVLYFEIDSLLPLDDERFAFLAPRGEKIVDGTRYHRLKTARLRGTYSQGLVLSAEQFVDEIAARQNTLADLMGVIKYEPPIPADLAGKIIGPFPTEFAPKTDAERVQNLGNAWYTIKSYNWYATEKIDGASVTYIKDNGKLRVCSRNWELEEDPDNTLWRLAEEYKIADILEDGWTIQAEVYGEGIQGNRLGIKGQKLAVFAILHNDKYQWSWPGVFADFAVPRLDLKLPDTIAEAVEQADGLKSIVSPSRYAEGIVWHTSTGERIAELDYRDCFKVISNKYLLKEK